MPTLVLDSGNSSISFAGMDSGFATTPGWNTIAIEVGDRSGGSNVANRAALMIGLDIVPVGITIISAILSMYVHLASFDGGPSEPTFKLHRLLVPFNRNNTSWNNRASGPTPWDAAGASGAGDIDPTPITEIAYDHSADVWRDFTITSYIAACLAGSIDNYGLRIQAEDAEFLASNQNYFRFRTTLGANPPKITLEYEEASSGFKSPLTGPTKWGPMDGKAVA